MRNKYKQGFYDYEKEKKKKKIRVVSISIFAVALIIFLLLAFVFNVFNFIPEKKVKEITDLDYLWSQKNYKKLIDLTEEEIKNNPYDTKSLIYNGFSNYYLGISISDFGIQSTHLEKAIESLKKVRIIEKKDLTGKIDFILAKIYYIKGRYYLDESIYYFKSSLDLGYKSNPNDIFLFLGLSYSELGLYDDSLKWFKKVRGNQDVSDLVISVTHFRQKEYSKAEKRLSELLVNSKSEDFKTSCKFWIGKIYIEQNKYDEAINIYKDIIAEKNKNNSDSADAHYNLGLIYSKKNDVIKARSEWRKALRINPSHYGAINELEE